MIKVPPRYPAIETIRDISEPWINIWSGDEWGESMSALHTACHPDYGFSNEDCAVMAQMLWDNLMSAKEWADDYHDDEEATLEAIELAKIAKADWLEGGGHGGDAAELAKNCIDQMPGWVFGEDLVEEVVDEH